MPIHSNLPLGQKVGEAMSAPAVKTRILSIISRLEPDHWLAGDLIRYREAIEKNEQWFESIDFLNWYAKTIQPETYLEIGVRRGRSLAQVMKEAPNAIAFGVDLWLKDYGSISEQGIETKNPGPEFVTEQMRQLGIDPERFKFFVGGSRELLPVMFTNPHFPIGLDLINVDGDHSYEGAFFDIDITLARLAPGGALVFDDICHPACPGLDEIWAKLKVRCPDFLFVECDHGTGTGVMFKPPFDKLELAV